MKYTNKKGCGRNGDAHNFHYTPCLPMGKDISILLLSVGRKAMEIIMDLFEKICLCPSPAGGEQDIISLISEEIEDVGMEINADSHKNLIVKKMGEGKPIIVMAPLDTPCLYITHIDENGFLRFNTAGDIDKKLLPGRTVGLKNGVCGLISVEKDKEDPADMFIDIGAKSADEAKASVSDYAVIKPDFFEAGSFAYAPFIGKRAALYAALLAAKSLTTRSVYFVFASKTSISQTSPSFLKKIGEECEMLISIEQSCANDFPGQEYTSLKAGGGPALRMKDGGMMASAAAVSFLQRGAGDIALQREVALDTGIAAAAQKAYGGIWAASLGIPTRYRGNLNEAVCLDDIHGAAKIIINCLN